MNISDKYFIDSDKDNIILKRKTVIQKGKNAG